MPIGKFPEILSQQILVGIILVGRLGLVVRPTCLELKLPMAAHCHPGPFKCGEGFSGRRASREVG